MIKGYLLTSFVLTSLCCSAEALDRSAEFPGFPWHQPDQNIVIKSHNQNTTKIFETVTKRQAILECPVNEVGYLEQRQFPTVAHNGYLFYCKGQLSAPGTFHRAGVGQIVGLNQS